LNNEEYIIQSFSPLKFSESKAIALNVFTAETGTHTFSKVKSENLPNKVSVYLRDHETGATHNLADGNYQVNLVGNQTYSTRFELVFVNSETQNDDSNSDDMTTDVDDVESSNFKLLTNSTGYSLVNMNGIHGNLQILDVTGKVVWSKNNIGGSTQIEIDLNNLSSGIYFIRLENNGNRIYTNKIVNR
jgi:hypothetical protein